MTKSRAEKLRSTRPFARSIIICPCISQHYGASRVARPMKLGKNGYVLEQKQKAATKDDNDDDDDG
eukprot:SAG11_NODE_30610_length_299_cov_1.015000_1_plen_65_part_01